MIVRPAKPDDVGRVVAILGSAPTPRQVSEPELALAFEMETARPDGTGQWVVEEDDEVFGYIELAHADDGTPEALEVLIYLDPSRTGQKRGPRLLNQFVVPAAREGGAKLLTATPHTEHAVSLLRSSGFNIRDEKQEPSDPLAEKLRASAPKTGIAWDLTL